MSKQPFHVKCKQINTGIYQMWDYSLYFINNILFSFCQIFLQKTKSIILQTPIWQTKLSALILNTLARLTRLFFGALIIFNWHNHLNKRVTDIDRYLYHSGVSTSPDSRLEQQRYLAAAGDRSKTKFRWTDVIQWHVCNYMFCFIRRFYCLFIITGTLS